MFKQKIKLMIKFTYALQKENESIYQKKKKLISVIDVKLINL